MKTLISDQEARFEYELLVFENEVHEAMRCFYIWRTLKKAAPKSQKIFNQLSRNAESWNTVDNSVQSNSLIVLGRIFDKAETNNVERLLNLAKSCSAIFSKGAFRRRKEKQNPNASHIVEDLMKRVKEPTGADFKPLEEFVAARRRVYEKCYKQISRPAIRPQGARSRPEWRVCADQHDRIVEAFHGPEKAARRALALVPQWREATNAPPDLQHDREEYRGADAKIPAVAAVRTGPSVKMADYNHKTQRSTSRSSGQPEPPKS
jgi:HEPN superfamily AbiU2-like protein